MLSVLRRTVTRLSAPHSAASSVVALAPRAATASTPARHAPLACAAPSSPATTTAARTQRRGHSSAAAAAAPGSKGKVVLLYSGGLDTSTILAWLIEEGYDVVAYIANLGQPEDYEAARQKALQIGAVAVEIPDLREEFLTDYIFPSLQANAIYEHVYLMGTSLARPCISKAAIRIAEEHGAGFVAHGATGKGNDQVRFELSFYALQPNIQCIAPWRDEAFFNRFQGRPDLLKYAEEKGIPVVQTTAKPYSMDENMMHISYEAGILEDPANAPPGDMFRYTTDPVDAPDTPSLLTVEFEAGVPVRVTNEDDGTVHDSPVALFEYLNELGGAHGVGRLDLVENRFIGMKSRGVYETPAGTILRTAHLDLEGITMDREVRRLRDQFSVKFAENCYNGFWFSPEMDFIMDTVKLAQKHVTGEVQLRLYKGSASVRSRDAPLSLYDKELVSMDVGGGYDPRDAEGFIKINSIRLKAHHTFLKRHAERA